MRTMIGWMAALFASALLGAAVYQTVLSKPLPDIVPAASVETVSAAPRPTPTEYRTEIRTVVEPTPTVTIEDQVLLTEQAVPVAAQETAAAAATRTRTPGATPRATADRQESPSATRTEDSDDDEDDHDEDDHPESDEPDEPGED